MTTASIPLDRIVHNPWQTRQGAPDPEYIKSLALDIAANTLLQYPVGRLIRSFNPPINSPQEEIENSGGAIAYLKDNPDVFIQLAFGHNRLAAYQWLHETENGEPALQWDTMPVDLRELTDEQMAIMAWSENEKRRDHTPIERARAIEKRMQDFGWTQAQVADQLGISRPVVSNTLRLLKLPEDVLAVMAGGDMPERTAVALVSLFDLPESLRQAAETHYRFQPSKTVREALAGNMTSDMVRETVEGICEYYGKKLQDADFKVSDVFAIENIRSATCKDCEARFKERNLCLAPDCFARKTSAARTEYLEKAAQACGIAPIEDPHTSFWDTTHFTSYRNDGQLQYVLAAKCPNLRLIFVKPDRVDKVDPARVQGYPDAMIVCAKKQQFCTCLAGLNALKEKEAAPATGLISATNYHQDGEIVLDADATLDADELKEFAREARKEKRDAKQQAHFVMEEAAQRIAVGLNQRLPETWIALMRSDYQHHDWKSRDLWEIFLALATDLAEQKMPYEVESLRRVTKAMNELLKLCGLDLIEPPAEEAEDEPAEPKGKSLVEVFEEVQP